MKTSLTDLGYFTSGATFGLYQLMEFIINPYSEDLKTKKKVRSLFIDDKYKNHFKNGFISLLERKENGDSTYEVGVLLGLVQEATETCQTVGDDTNDLGISQHTLDNLEYTFFDALYYVEKVCQENFGNVENYEYSNWKTYNAEYSKISGYVVSLTLSDKGNRCFVLEKTSEEFKRKVSLGESSGIRTFHAGDISNLSSNIERKLKGEYEEKLRKNNDLLHEKETEIREKDAKLREQEDKIREQEEVIKRLKNRGLKRKRDGDGMNDVQELDHPRKKQKVDHDEDFHNQKKK